MTSDVLDAGDLERLVGRSVGCTWNGEQLLIYCSLIESQEEESQRKPGRASSTREDLLRQKLDADKREWESGYWVPDLRDRVTVESLQKWKGDWLSLAVMSFIRLRKDGQINPSSFPPKGQS